MTQSSEADYEVIVQGVRSAVLGTAHAKSGLEKLKKANKKSHIRLMARLKILAERGPPPPPLPKWYKEEGRHSDIRVTAIKTDQFRLYGATATINGHHVFVATEFDPKKDQNKANQSLLRSAASEFKATGLS